jgi:hypothetical protein
MRIRKKIYRMTDKDDMVAMQAEKTKKVVFV